MSDQENDNNNENHLPGDPPDDMSEDMPSDLSDEQTRPLEKTSWTARAKEKTGQIFKKLSFGRKKEEPASYPELDAPQEEPTSEHIFEPTSPIETQPSSDAEQQTATHSYASPRGESTQTSMRRMELLNLAEWVSKSLQNRGYALYGKVFTLLACTYFLADVVAILAGSYIPEPPTARGAHPFGGTHHAKGMEDYNVIFTRNLFNSKGIIPGEEAPSGPMDLGGAPVRTTLPFNLVGTLILHDEMRSIATIEDKSASTVYPLREEEEIPSKAKIIKIEPRRVIFVNTQSGRREFIDLPEEPTSNAKISVGAPKGPGIEQVATGQFSINRSEVDAAMKDFNKILTEARAVPNFENGVPNGYKLFQIVPGSIYDKLGLKNGDIIAGVDGQPINDPAKAFELLGKLKEGASHLELQVKKSDGKAQTYTYDIH